MPTPQEAAALAADGLGPTEIGARLGISRDAARRLLNKAGTPETITLDADRLGDIGDLLKQRGMNPDEWVVTNVVVNTWDGFIKNADAQPELVPLHQLKVFLRRRVSLELLLPVQPAALRIPKPAPAPKRNGRLVFVYGDDQRPNVDTGFEAAKLRWIKANRPNVIVDLGDGMDFPTVSGHKPNPAMNWSVNDCARSYANWLYQARCAAPAAEFVILADNHVTQRWRDYQLAQAAALFGVHPAEIEGMSDDLEPLLSIRRLLRLDEMRIAYLDPPRGTHYAESLYEIVPGELVAIHGYRTGANVGRKFLDDYGCSVIYGHVHGQDVYVTDSQRRGIGQRRRLYALGVGCGANTHGGGGFAPGADWQNCALAVTVFDDGGWTWDYLNYENGVLRWRDQRYEGEAA